MRRLNPAEKLSDVIDLLCARHYSGLLSVERFAGGQFQEGEIYFEQGRSVYARYNQQSGKAAFACLETWQQVYFALDKDASWSLLQGRSQSISASSYLSTPRRRPSQPLSSGELAWSDAEQLVPRKSEKTLDVLSLPLTRAQRAVYLLIDGKRSVVDLARCISKSILIVMKLLNDLLALGLIVI
jgi:hypothetical protein